MIEQLVKSLKEDPQLYYVYQSNIAMAFKDEYDRYREDHPCMECNVDIHLIANNAAKYFLNLLCKDLGTPYKELHG